MVQKCVFMDMTIVNTFYMHKITIGKIKSLSDFYLNQVVEEKHLTCLTV